MLRAAAISAVFSLALTSCGPTASVSTLADAKRPLPAREAKLYAYLQKTQITGAEDARTNGTWPSRATTRGVVAYNHAEANLFMPLQMSLALHRIAETYDVPGLDALDDGIAGMLGQYAADVATTGEPVGSLAHWALYKTNDDKWIRYAGVPNSPYFAIRMFDIPDDLDTSSQAFLWLAQTGRAQAAAFRDAYVPLLADWRDAGRTKQHKNDDLWKHVNSGAFLTWNEPEKSVKPASRVPGGVNDVDCVVNLNVLSSLAVHEKAGGTVPAAVEDGRAAACALLNEVVADGKQGVCAPYYDETQFHLAFARALQNGVSCLEPSRRAERDRTLWIANDRASVGDDVVDIAEATLALKLLDLTESRAATRDTIAVLEERLAGKIVDDGATAHLPEGVLYHGTIYPLGFPVTGYWLSPAGATAVALQALLTE